MYTLAPSFYLYVMRKVINFTVGYRPVSLISYNDEHEGPGFVVVVRRSRNTPLVFGRFKLFKDADEYRAKYADCYPFIKFDIYPTLF